MTVTFRRKNNRLGKQVYAGRHAYSLTMACHGRTPWFHNANLVARCLEFLHWAAEKHDVEVYAYCFMPDHVHLLVQGGKGTRLADFVHDYKQKAGYLVKSVAGRVLWQRSYYDHVLRTDEDLFATARYIAANPVRAGLVGRPGDYPAFGVVRLDSERTRGALKGLLYGDRAGYGAPSPATGLISVPLRNTAEC